MISDKVSKLQKIGFVIKKVNHNYATCKDEYLVIEGDTNEKL